MYSAEIAFLQTDCKHESHLVASAGSMQMRPKLKNARLVDP